MEYTQEKHGSEHIVQIRGRMTHSDHKGFRDILAGINASDSAKIVFDLSQADFLDSSALGMLLIVRDAAVQQERVVVLKGARDQVLRLIEIGKLHKYFEVI